MLKAGLVIFMMLGVNFSASAWWERAPTKSGDYCLDQVMEMLEAKFGTEFKVLDVSKGKVNKQTRSFWVKTDLCDGSFVFDTYVRPFACSNVHYGKVPNYIAHVYGTRDCEDLGGEL